MFAAHHCQRESHTIITSLTHIIAQLVTEFQLLPTQCVGYLQRGEVTTHIYTFSFPPSLPPYSYELTSSTYMTIDKEMHHPYPLWTLTNTRHQGTIAPHPTAHNRIHQWHYSSSPRNNLPSVVSVWLGSSPHAI